MDKQMLWIIIALILLWFLLEVKDAYSNATFPIYQTIAYEASNQGLEGMLAVANVILTRSEKRGLTPLEVIFQPYQFSCWKNGKPTQKRKLTKREIQMAKDAWSKAIVWDYDHYAKRTHIPYWAKDARSSLLIKDHIFYALEVK